MSITRNRELSQFGSFIHIDDITQKIGITSLSTPFVGIGTTNPGFKLDVNGDINLTGTFRQSGSVFEGSRFTVGTGSSIYRLQGNVGIGTSTLPQKLTVVGNVSAGQFISTVTSGTAPLTVLSDTQVTNLNASFLRGKLPPTGDIVGTTDTQTLTNKTLTSPTINTAIFKDGVVRGLEEDVNVVAAAATGTINFEFDTASIWYYTTNATANHTLNFRYSSSVSLNTALAVGDSITAVWLNTNGTTAYYPSAFQIDGSSVTPKVPAAITSGNASSIDAYSFTIIKTASATFTVLETQTKFA